MKQVQSGLLKDPNLLSVCVVVVVLKDATKVCIQTVIKVAEEIVEVRAKRNEKQIKQKIIIKASLSGFININM